MKTAIPGIDNFCLEELVAPGMITSHGARAIQFLQRPMVLALDRLSKALGPIIVNNYHTGGSFKDSGAREPTSTTGAPRSQHKLGGAFDCKFKRCTPAQAFAYLKAYRALYPEITCIEDVEYTPTWLHIDGRWHNSADFLIVKP